MTFVTLGGFNGLRTRRTVLSAGIAVPRKGRPVLSVSICADLQAVLGVQPGDRIRLEVGTMADAGLLRLSKADPDSHSYRLQKSQGPNGCGHFNAGIKALGVTEARQVRAEELRYKVDGGAIIAVLPGEITRELGLNGKAGT